MKIKNALLFILFVASVQYSSAQTFGVRAGLNYSTFLGPTISESNVTESYGMSNGFHFGMTYAYDFTDIFSLRAEIVYVQNGSKYNYDGDSYYIIRTTSPVVFEKGTVDYDLNISNAYISLPIMANYRINKKWEIFGGPYINFLIGPTGRGKLRFESYDRPEDITFRQSLDFNYNSNNSSEITGTSPSASDQIGILINGDQVQLQRFAGAYSRQGEKTGNKFNFLDLGVTAGAHYFLNKGFFVGFQVDYGFLDLTNNDVDISLQGLQEDNNFIFQEDKDSHFGIHASFGFRF